MQSLAPMLSLICAGCQQASHTPPVQVRTPEKLLERILLSARAKDWKAVEQHVYPLKVSEHTTMRDWIIFYIKEADTEHTGDCSYSEQALALLAKRCKGRFQSPPKEGWLDIYMADPVLRKLPKKRFALLQLDGVNVLVADTGGGYKLLFWEGMNHLLKKK